jgi:hypothetical protein
MAGLNAPCTTCKGEKRHKRLPDGTWCPKKGARAARKENPEDQMRRLREEVCALPDGAFAAHARAVAKEAGERQKKIVEGAKAEAARVKAEAKERLRDLALLTGDTVDLDGEDEEPEPEVPADPKRRLGPPVAVPAASAARHAVEGPGGTTKVPARVEGAPEDPEAPYAGPIGVCGAMCPENILIKCKVQTRRGKHEGLHHNPEHKKTWPQRMTAAERRA